MIIKLTLVSFKVGTKRYSFFTKARYVDGKAVLDVATYDKMLTKIREGKSRISFST